MTNLMNSRPRGQSPSLPKWIKPQLCKLVDAPPQGPEWLHEIKYDGYRMHARLDRGEAQLLTRTGLDWTRKYPVIGAALSALPAIRRISMGLRRSVGREDLVQHDPNGLGL